MSDEDDPNTETPPQHTDETAAGRGGMQDTAIIDELSRVLLTDTKPPSMPSRPIGGESKRLLAVTRVVNAYHHYLSAVANRPAGEMTAADVARLGMILKILEDVEPRDPFGRL